MRLPGCGASPGCIASRFTPRDACWRRVRDRADAADEENAMNMLSRWVAPLVLAIGFGAVATATPAPAQAQDDLTQVLVEIADVVMRGDTPYYRYGDYGYDDRLSMQHDRYGRPVYYRSVPRYTSHYRDSPSYGYRDAKCNKHGKCKVEYYSPRHDRDRYARYDRHDRDYWDDRRGYRDHRRWRDDDDDDDDD
jgi:hypothetical protein